MKDIKCLIAAAVFACLFFPTDARSGGTADELTQAQKDSVKNILSKYKNETLTSDEAKEIHRLMREVGVTGGAGEDNAVSEAEFDAEKLKTLAVSGETQRPDAKQQPDSKQGIPGGESKPGKSGGGEKLPVFTCVKSGNFILSSTEVTDGGNLPREFTGFGESATLPLEWKGAPSGTKCYALVMHHIDPEGMTKWYWVIYNIPLNTTNLPKNVKGAGILGNNSVNGRAEFAPPHSKGSTPKKYIVTVYALSGPVSFDMAPEKVSRQVLLDAIKGSILDSAELDVVYARPADAK